MKKKGQNEVRVLDFVGKTVRVLGRIDLNKALVCFDRTTVR
ncbi:hypothetical protein [Sinosporangium siamense]|uniref:Uncharacterized protein n=1 Tax=Sinosporangium siamense TaxID=1367973 RepID=A0A919V3Q6_9ACTN|nr:hypothetical protein [Sinosporangium siamense]GII91185.1 hypothetical protein Ssi02_14160 [Sinosporangium siamense]